MDESMDKTLGYLKEILSNYTDNHTKGKQLFQKLSKGEYQSEGAFVRDLDAEEIDFLNKILPDEIEYAKQEQDEKRAYQLNEVYELLF
jgi:Minor curli fiber component A